MPIEMGPGPLGEIAQIGLGVAGGLAQHQQRQRELQAQVGMNLARMRQQQRQFQQSQAATQERFNLEQSRLREAAVEKSREFREREARLAQAEQMEILRWAEDRAATDRHRRRTLDISAAGQGMVRAISPAYQAKLRETQAAIKGAYADLEALGGNDVGTIARITDLQNKYAQLASNPEYRYEPRPLDSHLPPGIEENKKYTLSRWAEVDPATYGEKAATLAAIDPALPSLVEISMGRGRNGQVVVEDNTVEVMDGLTKWREKNGGTDGVAETGINSESGRELYNDIVKRIYEREAKAKALDYDYQGKSPYQIHLEARNEFREYQDSVQSLSPTSSDLDYNALDQFMPPGLMSIETPTFGADQPVGFGEAGSREPQPTTQPTLIQPTSAGLAERPRQRPTVQDFWNFIESGQSTPVQKEEPRPQADERAQARRRGRGEQHPGMQVLRARRARLSPEKRTLPIFPTTESLRLAVRLGVMRPGDRFLDKNLDVAVVTEQDAKKDVGGSRKKTPGIDPNFFDELVR